MLSERDVLHAVNKDDVFARKKSEMSASSHSKPTAGIEFWVLFVLR